MGAWTLSAPEHNVILTMVRVFHIELLRHVSCLCHMFLIGDIMNYIALFMDNL